MDFSLSEQGLKDTDTSMSTAVREKSKERALTETRPPELQTVARCAAIVPPRQRSAGAAPQRPLPAAPRTAGAAPGLLGSAPRSALVSLQCALLTGVQIENSPRA